MHLISHHFEKNTINGRNINLPRGKFATRLRCGHLYLFNLGRPNVENLPSAILKSQLLMPSVLHAQQYIFSKSRDLVQKPCLILILSEVQVLKHCTVPTLSARLRHGTKLPSHHVLTCRFCGLPQVSARALYTPQLTYTRA